MITASLTERPDFLSLSQDSGFFPVFLASHAPNPQTGRYSILAAAPNCQHVAFDHEGLVHLLEAIDQIPQATSETLPFTSGWLVYLSYECAGFFEPKLASIPMPDDAEPLAVAIHCNGAVLWDHEKNIGWVSAVDERTLAEINQRIDQQHSVPELAHHHWQWQQESPEGFKQQVADAKNWIESGDIYQANLSRQWLATCDQRIEPLSLFSAIESNNPAPFAALLQTEHWSLISASPERLVQVKNGEVSTRPIAGTRPRSHNEEEDLALVNELLNTPKERAEHIMLIDLERNDIGRVSRNGTVQVDELMVIESYPTVHHIVSNVKGQLKTGISCVDVLRALFPGGTITGCPKIRCMEIIAESERRPRGFYTGSIGYINHDGQMDFNILIRSMAVSGQQLKIFAGAGIVYDSDPEAELKETGHKAKGLFNALGVKS